MGGAKAWMMEQEARGFNELEGNVCAECFAHPVIKDFIAENLIAKKCDYCGVTSKKKISTPLDDVMGLIMRGIIFEWRDPDSEGISYEGAEGGYQASLTDAYDLIYHTYDLSENEAVLQALLDSMQNLEWVQKNYYIGSEEQRFTWAWEQFCREVMHKKRFLFLHQENKEDFYPEIMPSDFLFRLAEFKNRRLDQVNLIREVSTDTSFYRVRIDKKKYSSAKNLGAPPVEHASRSNRMSPAGIPMFYGAFDGQTSIKETYDAELGDVGKWVSIGEFKPTRNLKFLDLASLPEIPSVFEIHRQHLIHPLSFFHGFAEDIAKPVSRNGREHVEYVPTQVITEFFRHIYRTSAGKKLDGIIYRSTKNKGKEACVIFCENHQACEKNDKRKDCLLRLIKSKAKSLKK